MTRFIDRQKAISLRKQGKTYGEIKRELQIPKSTLSEWLSKFPLSQKQLKLLEKSVRRNKDLAVEKIRLTKRKKREARLKEIYIAQKKNLLPLSKKELEIAGLFLYWGEGQKSARSQIGINNTDPKVVKFSLYWATKVLKIPQGKIKVYLQLYSDMKVEEEMKFWSKELRLPLTQFAKPYIKTSTREHIDHKGFGHGTCGLLVGNVRLKEKILMSIEAVANHYCSKI